MTTENTSLNKCKRYAMFYLHTKIKESDIPIILLHPFIESSIIVYNGVVADIINNTDARTNLLSRYELKINHASKIEDLFKLIRPQYRLQYFASVNGYLNKEDYAKMLSYSWKSSIIQIPDAYVKPYRILHFFKRANKNYLMSEHELTTYNNFPEKLILYRGIGQHNECQNTFSWTISKDRASWFANGFNEGGKIIEKEIDKKSIIAYFEYGEEYEVIVDYKMVENN